MEKNYFDRMQELLKKEFLTFDDVGEILDTESLGIDIAGDIIQYTDLTKNQTDLMDFTMPNTKETWIEIAKAIVEDFQLSKPIERSIINLSYLLKINPDEITQFLVLRGYIVNHSNKWMATALGIEVGCVVNRPDGLFITEKGASRIKAAFKPAALSDKELQEINDVCAAINGFNVIKCTEGKK